MTAVDYIVKEISVILGPLKTDPMQDLLLVDAIERANKMFEQQIIDAYMDRMDITDKEYFKQIMGGEYYNKTYKQDI